MYKQSPGKRVPGWKPKKYKYQKDNETEIEARDRITKYQYQENMITKINLFENADTCIYPDSVYNCAGDGDAIPFIFRSEQDVVFIGDYGEFHSDSLSDRGIYRDAGTLIDPYQLTTKEQVQGIKGRVWMNQEIISFWEYPQP